MTRNKLRELQRRISKHFYDEARIMRDILRAKLTQKETDELVQFMNRHPYARIADQIIDTSQKTDTN